MIILYKNGSNSFTDRIEEKLKEMVLAHEIIEIDSSNSLPPELDEHHLPALSDGYQVWTTPKEINKVLEELDQELRLSRSIQSDACHLDPDDPQKCL